MLLEPTGSGCRVSVFCDQELVATSIENTDFEAAAVGVGMFRRWSTARSAVTCNKSNN